MSVSETKPMSKDYTRKLYTTDYVQYCRGTHNISVVGSLRRHCSYFKELEAPDYIIRILEHGYVLPLKKHVSNMFRRNNKSSRDCPQFVQSAIDELVDTGAVIELTKPARVTNPLTVSQKSNKLRLVLDLRHVNLNMRKHKCKIEGAQTFNKYLKDARYLFGFDLKSGYHHVDIHPSQHELLGFSYHDHTGKQWYFQFVVMPFGLSTAGFIFTQILRVLIKYWREMGIPVVSFFDDGLSAATSFDSATDNSAVVFKTLMRAGFIPNYDKSTWLPTQVLTWLGFIYDLINGIIAASSDKIDKAQLLRAAIDTCEPVHIKDVASFTGTLLSLHIALGDIVYIKAKNLQILIASMKLRNGKQNWNCKVTMNKKCRTELLFWKNYLATNNSMKIHSHVESAAVSFSDASNTGTASLITPAPRQKELKIVKSFFKHESGLSSTFRELAAVVHGLSETKLVLKDKNIRWLTDNQNVVSIVRKAQ